MEPKNTVAATLLDEPKRIHMAIDVKLPELGDGIESGDVLELLVSEGDTVTKDQSLLELETDKATMMVPSPAAGKVAKILVSVGETVPIGGLILQLEAAGAAAPPPVEAPAKPAGSSTAEEKPAPPEKQAASAPMQQESQPAEKKNQPVAADPKPPVAQSPAPAAAPVAQVHIDDESDSIAAGPAVRRFAREVGVDLSRVTGSGEGGRITREDVLRAVRESSAAQAAPQVRPAANITTSSVPIASPVGGNKVLARPGDPGQDDYGPVRVERLSKIRKTIATQMLRSWSTVPRVTNFDDADVTDLEAFRNSSKDDYAAEGIKLTTMPFLIKAVATALRHHPTMNAMLDMEHEQIIYRDYVNVGIAIDTDRGLVVPNIRHADASSVPDIAKALAELAARVRGGEFGVNELRGGTFTISNLGAIGGTYSTPIVNVPEVAILLVGRTRKLPVVMEDDSIRARLMMPLSLSYDHRLVDGGTAARFLNDVIAYLEAPSRLLLAIN
ncbi:MAG: 2-oxo acid dehydrogenase subunit E2 [Planctomycetales bacterium]|nr:2-oxo acid dehydrogenase subunit E2 [Planctomycetales bacterium]